MSGTLYHIVAERGRKEKKDVGNLMLNIFCAVYFQLTVQLVLMFFDVMAVVYS
jgi:hypothetical protein